jgi:hypothetical protein
VSFASAVLLLALASRSEKPRLEGRRPEQSVEEEEEEEEPIAVQERRRRGGARGACRARSGGSTCGPRRRRRTDRDDALAAAEGIMFRLGTGLPPPFLVVLAPSQQLRLALV